MRRLLILISFLFLFHVFPAYSNPNTHANATQTAEEEIPAEHDETLDPSEVYSVYPQNGFTSGER